jgi:hypothetical protein
MIYFNSIIRISEYIALLRTLGYRTVLTDSRIRRQIYYTYINVTYLLTILLYYMV